MNLKHCKEIKVVLIYQSNDVKCRYLCELVNAIQCQIYSVVLINAMPKISLSMAWKYIVMRVILTVNS